jgi:hypothetical protein
MPHEAPIAGRGQQIFDWNNATISPSLMQEFVADWEDPTTRMRHRCHGMLADGKFTYGLTCTHDMVGKTILLPSWIGDDYESAIRPNPMAKGSQTGFWKRLGGTLGY